jgi:Spy/CpxP family protein refolding chaperone
MRMHDMTKRTLIGMLVCLAVLAATGWAWAQDADPGGRWWRDPGVSRDLNLNDRERRSLDRLYSKNRDALIDRKADLEKERSRLADVMDREPFDEGAAKAQLRRVEEKQQRLTSERMQYLIEVRKILGPERFRTLEGKAMEQRGRRRDQRPGYSPGQQEEWPGKKPEGKKRHR